MTNLYWLLLYNKYQKLKYSSQTYMGNTQNKLKNFRLVESQWVKVNHSNYLLNTRTNQLGICLVKTKINEQELNSYILRHNHRRYLPDVKGVIIEDGKSTKLELMLKCSQQIIYKIIFEPIIFRLSDLGSLGLNDGLYILKQVFEGYRILSSKYGKFQIFEDLIGFTQEGQCKLWVYSNLYSQGAEEPLKIKRCDLQKTSKEEINAQNLQLLVFQLVEDRIRNSPEFQRYLIDKQMKLFIHSQQSGTKYQNNLEKAIELIDYQLTQNHIDCEVYRIQLPGYQSIQENDDYPILNDNNSYRLSVNDISRKKVHLKQGVQHSKFSLKKYNYLSQRRLKFPVKFQSAQKKQKSIEKQKSLLVNHNQYDEMKTPKAKYYIKNKKQTEIKIRQESVIGKSSTKYSSPTNYLGYFDHSNSRQVVNFHYDSI